MVKRRVKIKGYMDKAHRTGYILTIDENDEFFRRGTFESQAELKEALDLDMRENPDAFYSLPNLLDLDRYEEDRELRSDVLARFVERNRAMQWKGRAERLKERTGASWASRVSAREKAVTFVSRQTRIHTGELFDREIH